MSSANRSSVNRRNAHLRWAKCPDFTEATAPARAGLDMRFINEVTSWADQVGVTLTPQDLTKRVGHVRKAYYLNMAQKSAEARRERRLQAV
jgi:tRNA/tmRNA/rRNA uracil-C5-methylase (TrmA/RlmC/RlmD family)